MAGISNLTASVPAPIHATAKAPNGASDQITNLTSGGITATPQRDGANRITGYIWSDGTNTVTQTWQRGAGGRIEFAGSDVAANRSGRATRIPCQNRTSFLGNGPQRRRLGFPCILRTLQDTGHPHPVLSSANQPAYPAFSAMRSFKGSEKRDSSDDFAARLHDFILPPQAMI